MIIKLDVDGVLKDMVTPSIQIYKEYYDSRDNTVYDDIKVYNMSIAMPGITDFYKFFMEHGKYIFGEAKPYDGAVDFVKELKKQGHTIAITTNQIRGLEKYTIKWLQQYHIPYDSLHYSKDKSLIKGDLLIDDCIDNLLSCKDQEFVACFSQPWNQEWTGLRFNDYEQALSWTSTYNL